MKIKNIEEAAKRIKSAVEAGEQIIIFADSDMDGVSSAVILKETIDNLISSLSLKDKEKYPAVPAFFPDRKNEGYGLNEKALEFIKEKFNPKGKEKAGLLITLDCGITNFEEIKNAREFGFEVIIIDHHTPVSGQLPEADLIVDPKQPEDNFLFKEYCNAGLVFKLAVEILKEKMSGMLREVLLELTALATIADMMIEEDENRDFIFEGLINIEKSNRPSLRALVEVLGKDSFPSKRDLVSKINGILNSSKMENHVMLVYAYLIEPDFEKAKKMAKEFIAEHENRQKEIISLTDNLKYIIGEDNLLPVIFQGSSQYNIEFLGAVASRLTNYYNKPVFLYQKYNDFSRGTVRLPKGLNAVKAMESCKNLLRTFGGHPAAAGFTVKNENLELFREALFKYFHNLNLK
ncbi:MAG: DHH family phosphoesterase [Candidatus Paceibacterota bacterium]